MSFSLYGPVATITKTYTDNITNIKLAGDKILAYFQGANEWAMYDLKFNKILTLKNTYDFSRWANLTVHRLNKNGW